MIRSSKTWTFDWAFWYTDQKSKLHIDLFGFSHHTNHLQCTYIEIYVNIIHAYIEWFNRNIRQRPTFIYICTQYIYTTFYMYVCIFYQLNLFCFPSLFGLLSDAATVISTTININHLHHHHHHHDHHHHSFHSSPVYSAMLLQYILYIYLLKNISAIVFGI